MSIVPRRGPRAFKCFIFSLMKTDQRDIAKSLSPEFVREYDEANGCEVAFDAMGIRESPPPSYSELPPQTG